MSEPHIDRDISPRIYVCIYVSNIFTRICHTLLPKIRVHPETLCVFRYIDVLTCVIYNGKQGWLELLRRRQVGECADTDMV